jgi:hypothetical protein
MPTDRILVENCGVISANQINGVLPPSDLPFKGTPVSLTEECPTCGTSKDLALEAIRTRQGPRFFCPKCRRKVQKLYRPNGGAWNDWACKECHGLVYSSQYGKKIADIDSFGVWNDGDGGRLRNTADASSHNGLNKMSARLQSEKASHARTVGRL